MGSIPHKTHEVVSVQREIANFVRKFLARHAQNSAFKPLFVRRLYESKHKCYYVTIYEATTSHTANTAHNATAFYNGVKTGAILVSERKC